jgi:mannose-6-phosphate isomerase-like protein (cupin superfamily)
MSYQTDVVAAARSNSDFRRELYTDERVQLVLMTLPVGEEIGEEVHEDNDQVLVFVDGSGEAVLEGRISAVSAGNVVVVPAGTKHNFRNTGSEELRLYTIYSPPEHAPGTVHRTRAEAEAAEHGSA